MMFGKLGHRGSLQGGIRGNTGMMTAKSTMINGGAIKISSIQEGKAQECNVQEKCNGGRDYRARSEGPKGS